MTTLFYKTFKSLKPKPKFQKVESPIAERPETAKPKGPDEYEFENEQVAKDYRKMWEKMQAMEALLAQQQQGSTDKPNDDPEDDDEQEN